jgi:site-specific DNA recombinase
MYGNRNKPLAPRNGHTLRVAIVARISGCANQKEISLEDQIDHAKEEIQSLYQGPVEYIIIATKGKGERLDRAELAELEELIRTGDLDGIVAEDLGRIVRGVEAHRLCGLAVDAGVRVLSPNDGIDTADQNWEEDVLDACKEHLGHNTHTSRRLKHKLMNRFRKLGGAPARPIFGYIVPEGVKRYDEWTKDPAAEQCIRAGWRLLKDTLNCTAVADHFNRLGVPVGPYCHLGTSKWSGAMVRRFYSNTLLKGKPGRGFKRTVKHNESGRRVSVKNPDGPLFRDCPHLAHLTEEEFDSLNVELRKKNGDYKRRPVNGTDPLFRVPRKRTRFPGQHATCYYCGRPYSWGGNGNTANLMCAGSREYFCWNSFGFCGEIASRKLVDIVLGELKELEGFEAQFAEMVRVARDSVAGGLPERMARLRRNEEELAKQKANFTAAIREYGPKDYLTEQMGALDERTRDLALERRQLDVLRSTELRIPENLANVWGPLREELSLLAADSPEFGDLMRRLVPEFQVFLVRLCDGGHPLPRARLRLNLGGSIDGIERLPALRDWFTRTWTIDLFDAPPQRELIRPATVALATQATQDPQLTYEQIAQMLPEKPTATAVGNALHLHRKMVEFGLGQPFVLLREPPTDYTKLRRNRNAKYRFEPLSGYVPPEL